MFRDQATLTEVHQMLIDIPEATPVDIQIYICISIAEAVKAGATLSPFHHGGVWTKTMGKFSCCGQIARDAQGCVENDFALAALSPSPRPASSSSSSSVTA